jgi:hypothetical protein
MDDPEYTLFRDLMNMFDQVTTLNQGCSILYCVWFSSLSPPCQERKKMEAKYRETTALLRKALEDIIYLSAQNEELEQQLAKATNWEPRFY